MQLEFFLNFPSMERENLRDLKKGIDLTFKDFSREYGDSIEGFFGPLLKFLVWFEKFLRVENKILSSKKADRASNLERGGCAFFISSVFACSKEVF